MKIAIVISVVLIVLSVATYPKWSYKAWYERSKKYVIPWSGEYKE